MRRAPIVLTGTAVGLTAVLTFHPRTPQTTAALATTRASAAPADPASPVTSAPGSSPSTGATGGAATGSAAAGSSASKTATGKAVSTPYGNAQVQVTIKNGKITQIKALQLQGNDPKSVQISGSAEPVLQQEALQKQSAVIDVVSGATYTSDSYEASLQSALDQAGFKAADGARGTTTIPNDIPRGDDHDGGPGDGGPGASSFGPGGGSDDGAGAPQGNAAPQAPSAAAAPAT